MISRHAPTLFDPVESEWRKRAGMALAAAVKGELLARAKAHAVRIAATKGTVTADDVAHAMESESRGSWAALGNAAGSVFKGIGLRPTGRYLKSVKAASHARRMTEWEVAR